MQEIRKLDDGLTLEDVEKILFDIAQVSEEHIIEHAESPDDLYELYKVNIASAALKIHMKKKSRLWQDILCEHTISADTKSIDKLMKVYDWLIPELLFFMPIIRQNLEQDKMHNG